MAKTLTKEQIIEQVKKKFYGYLYHIDVIGCGCMYAADLLKIFKRTKSNSQIYRDIQKLVSWNVLGEFNRDGKKVMYIKRLGNRILEKDNLKELRRGTEKLEMTSIRTELFLLGEEFYLDQEEQIQKLFKAVKEVGGGDESYWKRREKRFFKSTEGKHMTSFKDFNNKRIYLKNFKYTADVKELTMCMILSEEIQQKRFIKYLEDLAYFLWSLEVEYVPIQLTVYSPYECIKIKKSFLRAIRKHWLTRRNWGRSTTMKEIYSKIFNNEVKFLKLNTTHNFS